MLVIKRRKNQKSIDSGSLCYPEVKVFSTLSVQLTTRDQQRLQSLKWQLIGMSYGGAAHVAIHYTH